VTQKPTSKQNINKHGVDLSNLVASKSVIRFYDEKEKAVFTGTYLRPGENGWLIVRFGHKDWDVHPDYIRNISDPDPRLE
jgi:hypothetical protein